MTRNDIGDLVLSSKHSKIKHQPVILTSIQDRPQASTSFQVITEKSPILLSLLQSPKCKGETNMQVTTYQILSVDHISFNYLPGNYIKTSHGKS
jgi:hypothetical protein